MIQVIPDVRPYFAGKELKENVSIGISVGEPTAALGQQKLYLIFLSNKYDTNREDTQ
jgi:hypothetical protein